MNGLVNRVKNSLSLKLGLSIGCFIILVFLASLGLLFVKSRQLVKQEALDRARKTLDKTTLCITGYIEEVETATKGMEWYVMRNLRTDSLINFTRRIVALNPDVNGCSITMEPDFFPPSVGRFSAYSVREGSTITTVREEDYDYYSKEWYKAPKQQGEACWIDPYDDYNAGTLSSPDMIASYSLPLFDGGGRIIGVISTDLSLQWLSNTITREKPYPHSYSIMLGRDGRYFVHPDSTKLFVKTITSDANPMEQGDIIVLGHEMLAGNSCYMKVKIDNQPCYVFYQPLKQTGWSIGLVCHESDILGSYNRLGYVIFVVILVGLVLIFLFFRHTVSHFVEPMYQLVRQLKHIASGHFSENLPRSERRDVVGQLQNSFVTMQESLATYVGRLQQAGHEAEERNRQLVSASLLAQQATKQKVAFIQDVSHQIRTPLNIIQGFFTVLKDSGNALPQEEKDSINETIQQNVVALGRMVNMLVDASKLLAGGKLDCTDEVGCNDVAREAIDAFNRRQPYNVELNFNTALPDKFHLLTDRQHLYRILRELLFNAKKHASGSPVSLIVSTDDNSVTFIVEDHGPGIPEQERENIFTQFSKVNSFSEGLGLGLNLSRQFARAMGGELTLDTAYTHGCRFVLSLPKQTQRKDS